jgi:hypothetical protein
MTLRCPKHLTRDEYRGEAPLPGDEERGKLDSPLMNVMNTPGSRKQIKTTPPIFDSI